MKKGLSTPPSSIPKFWPVVCILDLLITAFLGLIMRYKIIFPFRALDLGHTLHAHANFVFSGWVSLTLFSCIVIYVLPEAKAQKRIYRFAFYLLEITAIGILITFLLQGYRPLSITFLFLSFLASLLFVFRLWKDLKSDSVPTGVRLFIRGAFIWYLVSVAGMLILIYLTFSGVGSPIEIRSALYFFLHFQYNGWFTFCIFALLLNWLYTVNRPIKTKTVKLLFWLLASGLIPGYFLSILAFYPKMWAEIPSIISVLTDFTAALILFWIIIKVYPHINIQTPKPTNILWKIATLSFFLKIVMQAATLVPSLAAFAFSFRPLIIGFLHLTFLCFVSFFLIGYLLYHRQLKTEHSSIAQIGLIVFVIAVILSEVGLFTQSLFAFLGIYPFVFYKILFWITAGIFLGLLCFVLGNLSKKTWQKRPEIVK